MSNSEAPKHPLFLGLECGGTRTIALLADNAGRATKRIEAGPANLKLLSDAQLIEHFQSIARAFPQPSALGIGMAGARTETDWKRIRNAASKIWKEIPCVATNDLETALAAVNGKSHPRLRIDSARRKSISKNLAAGSPTFVHVLVLSGTGSCCYGKNAAGKIAKIGGWGHILGDKGSGYEIGMRALKAVVFYYDAESAWPKLGERILNALALNEPNDLIGWVQKASKTEISSLAVQVFAAWQDGDKIAADILESAAQSLANDAAACAETLGARKKAVEFVLAGSVLLKQPKFARRVSQLLKNKWPRCVVAPLEHESVWGAVQLAKQVFEKTGASVARADLRAGSIDSIETALPVQTLGLSPTEQRNPRSIKLDKLSTGKAIDLMLSEEATVAKAIFAERTKIERVIDLIVRAFENGGRLIYVGAGTSGRLGVLDASECPPTFRTSPEMVQSIMAGGHTALWQAAEGAEDDFAGGAKSIEFRHVNSRDVVVGIAASGRTPFVWGALKEAKKRGAKTALLCFNPFLKIASDAKPDVVIAPNIGPEILTGSTRLKAGTATKLVLNMLTTLSMVRIGKVISNLMVDLNPSNVKLRDRATRIVQDLAKVDYEKAQSALEKSGWTIKKALARFGIKSR
jgi:N-acetylmuramic acid 6-phosphate etherase